MRTNHEVFRGTRSVPTLIRLYDAHAFERSPRNENAQLSFIMCNINADDGFCWVLAQSNNAN